MTRRSSTLNSADGALIFAFVLPCRCVADRSWSYVTLDDARLYAALVMASRLLAVAILTSPHDWLHLSLLSPFNSPPP